MGNIPLARPADVSPDPLLHRLEEVPTGLPSLSCLPAFLLPELEAPAWFALLIFVLFGSYFVISRLFALGLDWFVSWCSSP